MSTQTMIPVVTGFTYDAGTGAVSNIATEQAVYADIITASSVSTFNSLMGIFRDFVTPPATTPAIDPTASNVSIALKCLAEWSKMYYVDSNGVQHPTSDEIKNNPTKYQLMNDGTLRFYFSAPAIPGFSYVDSSMSKSMGQEFQSVVRLLGSFGFSVPALTTGAPQQRSLTDTLQYMTANNVKDTLAATIASAITAANASKTQYTQSGVQEMLMTDYVTHGNELIYNQMTQLQDAIETNQSVLSYCNGLQALMNQKDVETFTLALGPLSSYGTAISAEQYEAYEAQSFNEDIGTTASFTYADLQNYVKKNGGLLRNAFEVLDPSAPNYSITPDINATTHPGYEFTTNNVVSNLVFLYKQLTETSSQQPRPGYDTGALQNLRNSIASIYNNLTGGTLSYTPATSTVPASYTTQNFNTSTHQIDANKGIDLATWVANYDSTSGAQNDFQTNLTNATTASQSFNDAQREKLNEVMFVFQEFYQSASTLLSNINDIINRMAQMISK